MTQKKEKRQGQAADQKDIPNMMRDRQETVRGVTGQDLIDTLRRKGGRSCEISNMRRGRHQR